MFSPSGKRLFAMKKANGAHPRNSPMRIEFWKQPEQLVKTTLREVRGLTRPRFSCLLHSVHDELGPGINEYCYQEALAMSLPNVKPCRF